MLLNSGINRLLAGASLFLVSSLAMAQPPPTISSVTVGPLAVAAVTAVPTLTSSLLIVLGLLLAVIAVRTLRGQHRAQKLLSLVLLGGGLVLSGIGVDRTLAGEGQVIIEGAACNNDTALSYDSRSPVGLVSTCPNSVQVKSFDAGTCPTGNFMVDEDGCQQGQELGAGQSCFSLPVCNIMPPE